MTRVLYGLSVLIYDQRQHYQEEFSLIGFEKDTVFQSQVHSKDKNVSLNQSNQIKLLYHHYTTQVQQSGNIGCIIHQHCSHVMTV